MIWYILTTSSVTISDFNNQVRYSHIFPFPKIHHIIQIVISIGGQYEKIFRYQLLAPSIGLSVIS